MKKIVNKFYENMKKYIKDNYKELIFLALFACFCFYNTGYKIYKPGGTINSSERISGTNIYKSKGSFNMAYVSMVDGKLPMYLLAKILPEWTLVKDGDLVISDNETITDSLLRDHLYYNESLSNAAFVALKKSGTNFKVDKERFFVIYETKENESGIEIGDELISYDGIKISDVNTFIKYINTKKVNDLINIEYKRDGVLNKTTAKIYEEKDKLYIGISIIKIKEISSNFNLKVVSKTSESGPSGGLITTLAIYDAITKEDITKGYKIVGTGTIDENGNVGEIGSVTYKLASAVKDKADIFICPKKNYKEAIAYSKKHKYNIIIKSVTTFDEAVDYLNSLDKK